MEIFATLCTSRATYKTKLKLDKEVGSGFYCDEVLQEVFQHALQEVFQMVFQDVFQEIVREVFQKAFQKGISKGNFNKYFKR